MAFLEPSLLDLDSINVAGATWLTVQDEPAPKPKVTLALRETASPLAFCNPLTTDSAALRTSEFLSMVCKLGNATAANIPMMATATIISISVKPDAFDFGNAFNTPPLCW